MRRNLRRTIAFAAAVFLLAGGVSAGAEEDGDGAAAFSGYLFRLKEDAPATVSLMAEDGESGISAVMPDEGIYRAEDMETLARYTDEGWLEYVEPDYYVYLDAVSDIYPNDELYQNGTAWHLDALGMRYAWDRGLNGTGVRVAVIDSGINREHEDFRGIDIEQGYNYYANDFDTNDTYGHGTLVASVIASVGNNGKGAAGVAPGVTLIPYKCFEGSKTNVGIVCQAIKAAGPKCDVMNLSFGLYRSDLNESETEKDEDIRSLDLAIKSATDAGTIVVAAGGNKGKMEANYPAAYPNVIGVGAVDQNGRRAYFSNRDTESIQITAPGVEIWGADIETISDYQYNNGTSFAAPCVTGIVALMLSVDPNLTGEQVQDILMKSAVAPPSSITDPVELSGYGAGQVTVPRVFEELLADMRPTLAVEKVADDTLSISAVYLPQKIGTRADLFAAAYSASGRLLGVAMREVEVGQYGWGPRIEGLELHISAGEASEVRVFLADADNGRPLSEALALPVP